jgi:hypothetical protein
MLRDLLLAVLAVPLSDPDVTRILARLTPALRHAALVRWLEELKAANAYVAIREVREVATPQWTLMELDAPDDATIGFRIIDQNDASSAAELVLRTLVDESATFGADLCICALCVDETQDGMGDKSAEFRRAVLGVEQRVIFMEPRWLAAIVVEQLRPFLLPEETSDHRFQIDRADAEGQSTDFSVRRTKPRLQSLFGTVVDDPGTYSGKLNQLKTDQLYGGTILLCTTFLPPVTHPAGIIERFYRNYGATKDTLRLIKNKVDWEREVWTKHIKQHQRIDIVDRGVLEEYFAAPEYYQMPLTRNELEQQLKTLEALLGFENYSLCLASEAIDIPFELRGTEVRIRTDRRNKGQPRAGRISSIVINDRQVAEVFEREFWAMYRLTEPRFKVKSEILDWAHHLVKLYSGEVEPTLRPSLDEFDVFLCHNSADKAKVKAIGKQLIAEGLSPWLDEWNLIPGRPWQRALEAVIPKIKSAAVFVGENGIGPWMNMELDAFLREFVRRGCPVIPVILPQAKQVPTLPIFLQALHWVDFRKKKPNPLDQFIWGIRGVSKPR